MENLPEVENPFDKILKNRKKSLQLGTSEGGTLGSHHTKVPKGYAPQFVNMTNLQKTAWQNMHKFVEGMTVSQELEDDLLKAHINLRGEEYLSYVLFITLVSALVSLVAGIVVGVLMSFAYPLYKSILVSVLIIFLIPFIVYFMNMKLPSMKASARARDIDKRLASAMGFIAAMGSADVNIDVIFKELSKQKLYGEIRNEALWITRDTEILGYDILTAMKNAVGRTPSRKFQDFLQGAITTVTSGGQLKPYFMMKTTEYERDAKLDMAKMLETFGMLAESFVTVVVAFPLFLVVILAIMAIVGGNGVYMMNILWIIVLVMIPASQFMFIFIMGNMTKA